MNNILKYLTLGLFLILMGCSDEPDNGVKWTGNSKALVKKGINTDYQKQELTLTFSSTDAGSAWVHSYNEWLHVSFNNNPKRGKIEIVIDPNKDDEARSGKIGVRIGSYITEIHVAQDAPVNAVPIEKGYVVGNEANTLQIPVTANGTLTAKIAPADCDWVKISNISKDRNSNDWIITLNVEENTGLGRLAGIEMEVNGLPPIEIHNPYVAQQPGLLGKDIDIEILNAGGTLQILLGNDSYNLREIRNLTVKGYLNALDLAAVSHVVSTNNMAPGFPALSIDLSKCGIVPSYQPINAFGWQPYFEVSPIRNPSITAYLFQILSRSIFLVHVGLPEQLNTIPTRAFYGCSNLQSIDLPVCITRIDDSAFAKCPMLTQINIPDQAYLISLGNHVFNTGSVLESLYLPASLTDIAQNAFAGCKVKNLHVHWTEPKPLEILPEAEGCTLYVPKGCADVYRSTPNWNRFTQIVEE